MHKIIKIILIVLSIAGFILWTQMPSGDMMPSEAIGSSSMNFMFIITFVLLAFAVIVSLFFGLKNVFSSPEGLKRTLIGVGGLVVVAIISYFAASGTDVNLEAMRAKGLEADESTVKNIGTFLNIFFILTIIAVGAMVVPGIKKMFNK
jgi:flagellar biogenesis protein FliO